jgi:hypothetical protein
MTRPRIVVDVVVALWMAWWLVAGIVVGHEVRRLASVPETAGQLGHAVIDVGDAVRGVPLIGGQIGGSVHTAGQDAVDTAKAAAAQTRRVGLLIGAAIALIPNLPLILFYLPGRLAAERERQALRRALAAGPRDHVEEILARRAIAHVPYYRLRRFSPDPIADLHAGRNAALAAAELERLGMRRSAG